MACPHLVKGRQGHCIAGGGMFVPSIYERTHYCESQEAHEQCPLFVAHASSEAGPYGTHWEELWMPAGYSAPATPESQKALPVWPDRLAR